MILCKTLGEISKIIPTSYEQSSRGKFVILGKYDDIFPNMDIDIISFTWIRSGPIYANLKIYRIWNIKFRLKFDSNVFE